MGSENDHSQDQLKKLETSGMEALETLYTVSLRLNEASNLEQAVQAIALLGVNNAAAGVTLFTFELDEVGQPEWVQMAAAWTAGSVLQPIGTRFYLYDFPAVRYWLNNLESDLFIADTNQDKRIDTATRTSFLPAGTLAIAILPLIHREHWVGLIVINWSEAHPFTAAERRFYQSLANQAAVVVENRLLFEQTQRRAAQLEKLAEIDAALSRATHETEILAAIALLGNTTPGLRMTLSYLHGDETGHPMTVQPVASWYDGTTAPTFVMGDSEAQLEDQPAVSLWLDAPNAVLFIEDLLTDSRIDERGWTNATRQDIRAMVIMPLYSSGSWQGLITLCWPTPRVFTADEHFILQRLLEPATAAVASRRAYLTQQETRNFLASIIENIPVSLFIKDAVDLRFVWWNKASEELFGYGQKDILGKNDYDLFSKEEADFFVLKDREVLASTELIEIPEEPIETPHKGIRLLRTRKTAVMGVDGRPKYLLGISEDITERKHAEAKLANLITKLQTVVEVSMAASTVLDVPKLLQKVVDLTKDRFDLYHTHIYLLDEENKVLKLVAGAGEVGRKMAAEGWLIPLKQEQSLVARAARSRQGIITNHVRRDPDWLPNPFLPNTQAEMAVPMIGGDRVLGVLDVQAEIVNRFTQEDLDVKTTLASQVAVALQNAQLYEQVQTALQETQQSQDLLKSIIDATPDWIFVKDQEYRYQLVNQGYANALHLNPADFIGKNDLELGFPEELVKGNPDKGIRGFWTDDRQVMDSGVVLINPNDPATIDGIIHTFHTIKTPIRDVAGNMTGVLSFSRDVTEREQTLAETEALYNTSRHLSAATSLREIITAVAETFKTPAINRASLMIPERNTAGEVEILRVVANWSNGTGMPPIPVGQPYTGDMRPAMSFLLRPEPLFLEDVQQDEQIEASLLELWQQRNVRTAAILPLWTGGRQVGVLVLEGEIPYHFTSAEFRSYSALAGQMAVAVENRGLFEQMQASIQREQLLREVTTRIHSATDVTTVMRNAVQEVGRVLGRTAFVYLDQQAQPQTAETKEK